MARPVTGNATLGQILDPMESTDDRTGRAGKASYLW
jgi:hypothetical protein